MTPIPDDRDAAAPSPEFTHVREAVRCVGCGEVVSILTTVSVDTSGIELIGALAGIANVAGAGHLPPDHRWQSIERPHCPLCVALDHAETIGHRPTSEG
jgi:hypothetical protein